MLFSYWVKTLFVCLFTYLFLKILALSCRQLTIPLQTIGCIQLSHQPKVPQEYPNNLSVKTISYFPQTGNQESLLQQKQNTYIIYWTLKSPNGAYLETSLATFQHLWYENETCMLPKEKHKYQASHKPQDLWKNKTKKLKQK